jgi:hypothetical protein
MHWVAISILGLIAVVAIAGFFAFATGRMFFKFSPFYFSVFSPLGGFCANSHVV